MEDNWIIKLGKWWRKNQFDNITREQKEKIEFEDKVAKLMRWHKGINIESWSEAQELEFCRDEFEKLIRNYLKLQREKSERQTLTERIKHFMLYATAISLVITTLIDIFS